MHERDSHGGLKRSWRKATVSGLRCRCGVRAGAVPLLRSVSVQPRHTAAKRFDVLPDLLSLLACFLVDVANTGELQVGLQVAQRARHVVEMEREKSPVAELTQR